MVFASTRPPSSSQGHDLFIAFRKDRTWGDIAHLGPVINDSSSDEIEPRLGSDDRTLYFSSDRTSPIVYPRTPKSVKSDLLRERAFDNGLLNIWRIDLSPWLPE